MCVSADTEMAKLQRQFRIMEGDRQAYSIQSQELIRKQRYVYVEIYRNVWLKKCIHIPFAVSQLKLFCANVFLWLFENVLFYTLYGCLYRLEIELLRKEQDELQKSLRASESATRRQQDSGDTLQLRSLLTQKDEIEEQMETERQKQVKLQQEVLYPHMRTYT